MVQNGILNRVGPHYKKGRIYDSKTHSFNQRGQEFIQRLESPDREEKDVKEHIKSTDTLCPQLQDNYKENLTFKHNHSFVLYKLRENLRKRCGQESKGN